MTDAFYDETLFNEYGDLEGWTTNRIPRSRHERMIFRAMHLYLTADYDYERYIEDLSYIGSDEQWVIVLNMIHMAQHPDNFEEYLE